MLQAQHQRKMAQKTASVTPATSWPASAALSHDGTATHQNGTAPADADISSQVVPDTDGDSDSEMQARHPSAAPVSSHDSDTEVKLHISILSCCCKLSNILYIK